jgi:AmiR/NasT family two-component response regulator
VLAVTEDSEDVGAPNAALVHDEGIAQLVAKVENLHRAREHAAVIEQAKGVIMATLHCGPDAAFAVLVAQSQNENRKVHQIATEIAAAQDWANRNDDSPVA